MTSIFFKFPHHPSMHGVLRLVVTLDGEDVINYEPILGYLHQGMEKIAENRTIIQYLLYVTRWDYLATMFTEAKTVNGPEYSFGEEEEDQKLWGSDIRHFRYFHLPSNGSFCYNDYVERSSIQIFGPSRPPSFHHQYYLDFELVEYGSPSIFAIDIDVPEGNPIDFPTFFMLSIESHPENHPLSFHCQYYLDNEPEECGPLSKVKKC
ncbi:hypothetical protein UlMin_010820 [Ulmus minor]